MAFDAFYMSAVLQEIRDKAIGARVEKIHQPSRDTVILLLRCDGGREKLLFASISRRITLKQSVKISFNGNC